jgi:hypothetical protein
VRRPALAAVAAIAALSAHVFVATAAARATDASPAQVALLAGQALTDGRALASLRALDRVGGRRIDLGAALDARGPALRARLRTLALAAHAGTRPTVIRRPRAAARTILSQRRFRGSSVPRPLHRPLSWLGGELRRLGHALRGARRSLVAVIPGGGAVFWPLLGALVVGLAALVAARLGRRRAGRLVEVHSRAAHLATDDPRLLESDADEAERRGEYERALRLRFRAGLLRLAQAEEIPGRESLTNGEIARRLDSGAFRRVAADFDEVVYGRRAASSEDSDRARSDWRRVLEERRRQ